MSEILFNKLKLGNNSVKGMQVGPDIVKYCKLGSTLIYDTFSHYIYEAPVITVTYPILSRNGGTVTPTVTYTQKRTKIGHSGNSYSSDTISGTVTNFTASGSILNSSGATIVTSTGAVKRDSLGTTIKNSNWNIMAVTISATINGKTGTSSIVNVVMESNQVTSYAYSDPVLTIQSNLTAAGGYVDVTSFTVSRTPTYQTTSVGAKETGIDVTANADYAYTGTRFTRSGLRYNHDNMTTNITTDTLSITAIYEGLSNTKTASVSNSRNLVSVYLVPYQSDDSVGISGSGSSATWNVVPTGGGYIRAKAYANYNHTSGSPLNDLFITDDPELTWSDSSYISKRTKGGYLIGSRADIISISNRTSTATYSYKYGSVTETATKSFEQRFNKIKSVALTVSAGAVDKSGTCATAGGNISITNSTSPSCSGTATLEAGSCPITLSTYGTLTGPTYNWAENTDYTTISGNGATATLTFGENMTLSDRSATVTRTASYSYSINSSYLASGGTLTSSKAALATVSVSQSKGYYTYSNPYDLSCTYGNVTAVGGTSSPSISYKQTYGWNGRTSGINTITGGSSDDGYTTYSISKACTGLSIASDTGIVTWAKNNATSEAIDPLRYGEITMTVSRNNKSNSITVRTTQLGETVTSYGAWTFNVTLGTPNIAASGGSSTINVSRPTRMVTLNTGDVVKETATTGNFVVTSSNDSFTLNNKEGGLTSGGVPSFTVSVGGAGAVEANAISSTIKVVFTSTNPTTGTTTAQVTKTVTRNASVYKDHEFQFSKFDVNTYVNAAARSETLTMIVLRRYKYTGSSNWASWSTITPADNSIQLTTKGTITAGSVSEGTTSTSIITIPANQVNSNGTSSSRTSTIYGVYSDGTKSCTSSTITITQEADAISSYGIPTTPVIGSGLTAKGGLAELSTASTVTNTYVSGKTLTGSVSYILGTSTFTNSNNSISDTTRFSINGSSGKVTHTTMGTNVGTDKVSVIARNTGNTSKTATSNTISITNAANATFGDISITNFSYNGNIGAGGGEITPSVSYTLISYYTSEEQCGVINSNATLTYTIANNRFTLSTDSSNNGKVRSGDRTTNIGNEITDTITVKVALNKKEATKTVTVKQLGNYVTGIAVKSHTFSYDNIGAGATASGNPKCASTPEYTFSSGSKSTTTPSTTYGTLSSSASYSIANVTTNGFTGINQTSGVLTATSRGATYEDSTRSSALVTRTLTYTWTPTSSYNSAGTKTGSGNAYTTCTQNANIFTSASWTSTSGGALSNPGTYEAYTQTKKVTGSTAASASVTLKLSSGSTVSSVGYGNISISYSWASNQSYATLTSSNAADLNVTMTDRGSTTGSARTAKITRTATIKFALTGSYETKTSCALSTTKAAEITITQKENAANASYKYKNLSVSLSNNLTAGGGYAKPTVTATKVGYYTSGAEGSSTTGVDITSNCTFTDTEWFSTSSSATSGTTISRFTWDSTNKRYNHSSMTSNVGYDYIYVSAVTSLTCLDTNTKASGTIKVQNSLSYNNPTITGYTYGTFNKAGQTLTPTVTWTQTSQYTSGTAGPSYSLDNGGNYGFTFTNSNGFTLNSTTTGSMTASDNQSSNTRTPSAMPTVKVTYNGKTSSAYTCTSCTQAKGTISYGDWTGGAISFSSTSDLSAGADSRTVTIQPWKRTRGWNNSTTNYSGGEEVYTGNVTVTENSSYTSLSANSYKASSSAKTLTLTKSTCGTDHIETRTQVIVTANPDTDGPNTTSNSIYFAANTRSVKGGTTTYGDVTAGTITNKTIPASGTTSNVTATATNGSQTYSISRKYYLYASGSEETISAASSDTATIYPSISSISAKADSKGTTESGVTTIKSQEVIWASKDGDTSKNKKGFMYIYQAANTRSLASIYLQPYQPDSSWIVTTTGSGQSVVWSTCPATGGWVKMRGYANYTHTSGAPLNNQLITDNASGTSLTWSGSPAWITSHTYGGYKISENQSLSGRSSSATWSYGGLATSSKTLTQAAGQYNYGSWTEGSISISSSNTALSAGADSRTVTVNPWTRTYGWNNNKSGVGTDYYVGDIALTVSGSYTTITKTVSFTSSNKTSSKSATLTKNTCGTDNTNEVTITVTATGPDSTIARATIKQAANDPKVSSKITAYGTPSITAFGYPTNANNTSGATQNPSITASCSNTKTWYWTSGSVHSTESVAVTPTLSYSVPSGSAASVNSSGVVTWNSNNWNTTSTRSVIVTATAKNPGDTNKTATANANATLKADSTATRYKNLTISASYGNVAVTGGSSSPSVSYSYTKETYYASGGTVTKTEPLNNVGGTILYSGSATGASLATNGTVSWDANSSTSTRSITVRVTVNAEGLSTYKDVTCTLLQNTSTTSTEYSNLTLTANRYTSSSSACPASGGTATISASMLARPKYTWAVGSPTYGDWYAVSVSLNNLSGSAAGFSKSGATVTIDSLGTTLSTGRSCTYTLTFLGKTASVTIYQGQNVAVSVEGIDARIPMPALGGTYVHTPMCNVTFTSNALLANLTLYSVCPNYEVDSSTCALVKNGETFTVTVPNNKTTAPILHDVKTMPNSGNGSSYSLGIALRAGVVLKQLVLDEIRTSETGNSVIIPYEGGAIMGRLKYYEVWNGEIIQDPVLIDVPTDANLEIDPSLSNSWVTYSIQARAYVMVRLTIPLLPWVGNEESPLAFIPLIINSNDYLSLNMWFYLQTYSTLPPNYVTVMNSAIRYSGMYPEVNLYVDSSLYSFNAILVTALCDKYDNMYSSSKIATNEFTVYGGEWTGWESIPMPSMSDVYDDDTWSWLHCYLYYEREKRDTLLWEAFIPRVGDANTSLSDGAWLQSYDTVIV